MKKLAACVLCLGLLLTVACDDDDSGGTGGTAVVGGSGGTGGSGGVGGGAPTDFINITVDGEPLCPLEDWESEPLFSTTPNWIALEGNCQTAAAGVSGAIFRWKPVPPPGQTSPCVRISDPDGTPLCVTNALTHPEPTGTLTLTGEATGPFRVAGDCSCDFSEGQGGAGGGGGSTNITVTFDMPYTP